MYEYNNIDYLFDLNILPNVCFTNKNEYNFGQNVFKNYVKKFYSSKFIDKIELYIGDLFIAEGVCILTSNIHMLYEIRFFKIEDSDKDIMLPLNLLSDYEIKMKKSCDSNWGTIYYTYDFLASWCIPPDFDKELYDLYGNKIHITICKNKITKNILSNLI